MHRNRPVIIIFQSRVALSVLTMGVVAFLFFGALPGQAASYSGTQLARFQNSIIDYRSRLNPAFKKRVRAGTQLIIVHTSELGLKSTLKVVSKGKQFANGRTTPGGHANYVVARNGTIYRILDKKFRADHAGLSMWNGAKDISSVSVGIEFVGYHYAPLTSKQYRSAGMLLHILKQVYGLADKDILTHSQIAYGRPNPWFAKDHRGRKRCAKNFDRHLAGLGPTWAYDPDVRAGRLMADPGLACVFYKPAVTPSLVQKSASLDIESNIISKANSAWAVAGEEYDAPTTVYLMPGGKTLAGDRISLDLGWDRLPAGTKVLLNQETEQVRQQAKQTIKTISGQMTAWSHAGRDYSSATTIYFLPSGEVLPGSAISDWDDLPAGTRLVVGYKGPFTISKDKTAYRIAGKKYKNARVIYQIPGQGPVEGNKVPDFNDLPEKTALFLPIAFEK